MKTPEERLYQSILKPLVENHTFSADFQPSDNKGVENVQRQILTLGFQKYMTRLEEGIVLLEYFGEWHPVDLSLEELLAVQGERETFLSQGIGIRDLKDLMGVTDDRIDLYHARVQDLLEREEFDAAGSIALVILTLCPEDPAAWIAFGVCEQLSGRLVRGAHALVAAIELLDGLLLPVLYCAKGLLQLGLKQNAKELLEMTIQAAKGDPAQNEFRKKAYMLYSSL